MSRPSLARAFLVRVVSEMTVRRTDAPLRATTRSHRTASILSALVIASLLVGEAPAEVGGVSIVIVSHDGEAPAHDNFSLRLRIANRGPVDLLECDHSVMEKPPTAPCVAVGFRRDRKPPRVSLSRLDRASLAAGVIPLAPGATAETAVLIPTPGGSRDTAFYFYLVTAGHGTVSWTEQILSVKVGPPPPGLARNIRRTRLLLAAYVIGTAAMVMGVLMRRRATRSR